MRGRSSRVRCVTGVVASLALGAAAGCRGGDDAAEGGAASQAEATDESPSAGAEHDGDATDSDDDAALDHVAEAAALSAALAGLWTGPVTQTPLGNFSRMTFDLRAAGPVLFGRVDLDPANSLRFSFGLEQRGDGLVLVYRNGGLFSGLSRDTRTILRRVGAEPRCWEFCAESGGCAYLTAALCLVASDRLELDVDVKRMIHVVWRAERAQARELPEGFPGGQSAGDGTQPFPPLPTLRATASWSAATTAPADLWILLAAEPCPLVGDCALSRWIGVEVPAGATIATVDVEQLHPATYFGTAVLDRDRNLASTLAPGPGDTISVPNAEIAVSGTGVVTRSFALLVDL